MTVLNDKLIAQREGNDHAGKESKDIQNQTMVPPDSRVGIENDDHGYCTGKEAGHICLKIGRIGKNTSFICSHVDSFTGANIATSGFSILYSYAK